MRTLAVAASGYIGGRLVPLLQAQGHDLVLMSRDARPLAAHFPGTKVVAADLLDPSTPPSVLERIQTACYLADSMGPGSGGSPRGTGRRPATSRTLRSAQADRGSSTSAGSATIRPTSPATWPAAMRPAPSSRRTVWQSPSSGRR